MAEAEKQLTIDIDAMMIQYWNHLEGHPGGSDANTLLATLDLTVAQRRELVQGIEETDLIHRFVLPLREALNGGEGQRRCLQTREYCLLRGRR